MERFGGFDVSEERINSPLTANLDCFALYDSANILAANRTDLDAPVDTDARRVLQQKRWDKERAANERDHLQLPKSYPDSLVNAIASSWRSFEERYNVEVSHLSNFHKVICASSSGFTPGVKIGEFNVPSNHLKVAKEIIDAWIHCKETSLNQKYGCTFKKDANEVGSDYEDLSQSARALVPSVTELLGIEKAFEHLGFDSKKLPINIEFSNGNDSSVEAFLDPINLTMVFLDPCRTLLATQKECDNATRAHQSSRTSCEAIADHELGHYLQTVEGWLGNKSNFTNYPAKAGWIRLPQGDMDSPDWYLLSKEGHYYKNDLPHRRWVRYDAVGRPIDSAGKVVGDIRQAAYLTDEQMRQKSVFKPSSDYFTSPWELDAEALKLLKLGGEHRKELMQQNAKLYEMTKKQDQNAINSTYGVKDGRPVRVRDIDGMVVENTAMVQARIYYFESRLLKRR